MLPSALITAIVLIQAASGQMANNSCPMNCFCKNRKVSCMLLMIFPMNLPLDTEIFETTQMNVRDIPPHAFSYLPDLKTIQFNICNIQNLQGCSFKDMPSIQEIRLTKTVIESIESYAFSGLRNVMAIELKSCKVGRIKPFAFYDIEGIQLLTLYNTHIRNFYSHGMYNVTQVNRMIVTKSNLSDIVTGAFDHLSDVSNMEMHLNQFWNMQCLVLEDLMKSTKSFLFLQNTFYCNCSVFWLVNIVGRVKFPKVIEKNRCHGPDAFVNKSTLWHLTSKELACPSLQHDREPECKKRAITPNPVCPTLVNGVFETPTTESNDGSFGFGLRFNPELILAVVVAWLVLRKVL